MIPGFTKFLETARTLALRDVLIPNEEYLISKIFRWYSKTFSTPLADVYDLPLEDVLRVYFEDRNEGMEPEELEMERKIVLESDDQRSRRLAGEDAEDAEIADILKLEREEIKEPVVEKPREMPKLDLDPNVREADLPAPKILPPDISMTFIATEDFEKEITGLGLLGEPPKKQS